MCVDFLSVEKDLLEGCREVERCVGGIVGFEDEGVGVRGWREVFGE